MKAAANGGRLQTHHYQQPLVVGPRVPRWLSVNVPHSVSRVACTVVGVAVTVNDVDVVAGVRV